MGNIKELTKGLLKENPIFVQFLGMCATLAVTTSVINGIGMGLSTTVVLVASNIIISLLRNFIPNKVRIAAYIIVIAGCVTAVEILGNGTFFGIHLFGEGFQPATIMILPPGAFLMLGVILAVINLISNKNKNKEGGGK